ncbi:MAG: acetyl-CoA C-acyltransferase [Bacteroidales bacterium]|nr:acetyl-CoA C-acyltransferase [Bacteroidales bacterium]
MNKEIYIVAAARTPIGSFGGSLSQLSATKLGAAAISGAISKSGIDSSIIDEVFFGNVLSANVGQAPARQAALFAGIPNTVPCTTINKVCASGMKSIMLGAQTIIAGDNETVLAGGMESMSNVPHYIDVVRKGQKLGHSQLTDGMIKDGLWDVYNDYHMGNAGELCAKDCEITREQQDALAVESYKRSQTAHEKGIFKSEIVDVKIPQRKADPLIINEDQEIYNVKFEKIPSLRPVFKKDGTVTAANASTINDGAAALILMSKEKAEKEGLKPIAKIIAYADAAHEPEWFTTAPVKAMNKALEKSGLSKKDIDIFEINEAFAVVSLVAIKKMDLDQAKVNIYGSGVSLGHPLGATGARIVVTLINALHQENKHYGMASLCNGGGGASAIILERM